MKKDNDPRAILEISEPALDLTEKRINGKLVYKGNFLNLYKDEVKASDGYVGIREYFFHPGAVAILPFIDKNTLLLERQWRYPLNKSIFEVPAGKIDNNENPISAAKRELLEETGYKANEWCYLGIFHPVAAYSNEVIHLFLARSLKFHTSQKTDDGECIKLEEMKINNLLTKIENNIITDAKTICFAFWLYRIKNSEYKPEWISSI